MILPFLFTMTMSAFAAEDVRDVTVKGNEGTYKPQVPARFEPAPPPPKKEVCLPQPGDQAGDTKCAEDPARSDAK